MGISKSFFCGICSIRPGDVFKIVFALRISLVRSDLRPADKGGGGDKTASQDRVTENKKDVGSFLDARVSSGQVAGKSKNQIFLQKKISLKGLSHWVGTGLYGD